MKRTLIIFVFIFVSLLTITGCGVETSTSLGLEIQEAVLAKNVAGTWQVADGAVFEKGDIVGLILSNVRGFRKGDDGLNYMDLDLEVRDPNGDVILDEKSMLGERGHIILENDASSPVGSINTTPEFESGEYTIKVIVYDRVGGGSASSSKIFTLE